MTIPVEVTRRAALNSALAATGRGDRKGFERFYDLTAPYVWLRCGLEENQDRREQMVEDLYRRVWNQAPRYDVDSDASAWLVELVRRMMWRASPPSPSKTETGEPLGRFESPVRAAGWVGVSVEGVRLESIQ